MRTRIRQHNMDGLDVATRMRGGHMKPSDLQVHAAFDLIIEHQDAKALNYAVNYAKAGMIMTGRELRTQCLYVLNNMTHWRGLASKNVRQCLKDYIK